MSSHPTDTRTRILNAACQLVEQGRGRGVRMTDIATAAGISRQAVYLHFPSRSELLVATARYLDTRLGIGRRMQASRNAATGVKRLALLVQFWGDYLPEIYGLAKALMTAKETDPAAAAAWKDRMSAMREECAAVVAVLAKDHQLASDWGQTDATDWLCTLLSVSNWELLTIESGWTPDHYTQRMRALAQRTLVDH